MVDKPAKCPKCDGIMEEVVMSAYVGWAKVPWQASWLKQFTATARPKRLRGLNCKECGYLELYTIKP